MFKKIVCRHCNEQYDEAFNECPHCHAKNEELDSNFKNIQMLHPAKQICLFLMGLLGFELLGIVISLILVKSGVIKQNDAAAGMLLNTVVYAILFVTLLCIANKDLIKIGKSFTHWKPYIAGLLCFGFIIVSSIIYSSILNACGVQIGTNENQQSIDVSTGSFPLTSLIVFGLLGPICEEFTYRLGLFSFLKRISKWLAYPVAILVFALIHFNFDPATITNELLNLPYYILAGFALTFTYDKTGFAGSTAAHVLNNFFSLLFVVFSRGIL